MTRLQKKMTGYIVEIINRLICVLLVRCFSIEFFCVHFPAFLISIVDSLPILTIFLMENYTKSFWLTKFYRYM